MDKKLTPLDKKLEEILTSINFLSAKYDELVKKVDTLEDKNKGLEVENKRLNDLVRQLELQVQQQAESISEIEQYFRRDCLEIRGIPVENNEETDKIVQAVGNLTNVVINPQDISVSHRLKERHGSEGPMSIHPPPIL